MKRAPLVPSVSEYHAVIVPIVVASALVFGGRLRDYFDGDTGWIVFLSLFITISFGTESDQEEHALTIEP